MFEQELKLFKKSLRQFQHEGPKGGFVVIYRDKVLGYGKTQDEALRIGSDNAGITAPFLVKSLDLESAFSFLSILKVNQEEKEHHKRKRIKK